MWLDSQKNQTKDKLNEKFFNESNNDSLNGEINKCEEDQRDKKNIKESINIENKKKTGFLEIKEF